MLVEKDFLIPFMKKEEMGRQTVRSGTVDLI